MKHKISVIIPVLDEVSTINESLKNILGAPCDEDFEVIVVDGTPHGETIQAIHDRRTRTAIAERGRSTQMNTGALLAKGETLLFLHADTMLPKDAMRLINSALAAGQFVGGAFDLEIASERKIFRVIEKTASFRSRITRIPYGDQALFIRKDYFFAMGGFRSIHIMEDVDLMRRIRKASGKICIIPQRVRTSARRWEREGLLCCTFRNWALTALYLLGFHPERLARFYR